MPKSTLIFLFGSIFLVLHIFQFLFFQGLVRASHACKLPIAPMGKLLTCLARVTLAQLRPTLWSTAVGTCRRDLQCFPSPRWENALLTCPFRFSSLMMGAVPRSTSIQYVPSAPETSKVPIAPMGRWLTRPNRLSSNQGYVRASHALKTSQSPHGKLTFCSFFAGRWCLCRGWHSVNHELPDLLQHSCLCARSSSKVPIALMGKLLTCLPFDSRLHNCNHASITYSW